MNTTTKLTAAALAAFAMAGCGTRHAGPSGAHGGAAAESASGDAGRKGECWGVNACKGQGACGGPEGHACAGNNSCKGKGWLSLTEAECKARDGKFKAG